MNLRNRFQERFEIYLFEWPKNAYGNLPGKVDKGIIDHHSGPKVNEFISFLKYFKISKPYKFATISDENNLISDLSLIENVLMNLNNDSLTTTKENEFNEIVAFQKNPHLQEILDHFTEGERRPKEASKEAIKCAQLLSAMLSDVQYIFLESPEKDLSYKMFSIFLKALKFHCIEKNINVFVSSANPELWVNEATFYIQRDTNLGFTISEIGKRSNLAPLKTLENDSPTLNFILPKNPSKKDAA